MFVDVAAIVAVLSDEPEVERCAAALIEAVAPVTSAIAVSEAAVALARPDKLDVSVEVTEQIRDLPPAREAATLALEAARRFRSGAMRLNLADCFHYACDRYYHTPILSTAAEFRFTDLETVP